MTAGEGLKRKDVENLIVEDINGDGQTGITMLEVDTIMLMVQQ